MEKSESEKTYKKLVNSFNKHIEDKNDKAFYRKDNVVIYKIEEPWELVKLKKYEKLFIYKNNETEFEIEDYNNSLFKGTYKKCLEWLTDNVYGAGQGLEIINR